MYNHTLTLEIPEFHIVIRPGSWVRLGRFESTVWVVAHGWYSWGGNREVCGWYLIQKNKPDNIKPLQKTDLDDIYLVED